MAHRIHEAASPGNPIVSEIDLRQIRILEEIGRGSFGTVYKAMWQNKHVALKYFDRDSEGEAFSDEVRQLSRVSHSHIIVLYGACTRGPHVCLVMEYADGGSLYNVLHCNRKCTYTVAHAMSWARQCAEGVAYLHAMKPRALIHRDLKPPNLLLTDSGRILKICDFGTAVDKKTIMTNNKGSAAWMAPEVFKGSDYTEKCDIFSWGIILWEVLSRQIPFKNIEHAYSIMWTIYMGNRPPLIEGCPKPIEKLMISCWDSDPEKRPSMDYVVEVMTMLCAFFPGADDPIEYDDTPSRPSDECSTQSRTLASEHSSNDEWQQTHWNAADTLAKRLPELIQELDGQSPTDFNNIGPSSISSLNSTLSRLNRYDPIPEEGARWASTEDDNSEPHIVNNDRLSSWKMPLQPLTPLKIDSNAWELPSSTFNNYNINDINPKSQGKERLTVTETKPAHSEESVIPPATVTTTSPLTSTYGSDNNDSFNLDPMHMVLEPELRPVTPDQHNPLSQEIFQEHKTLAKEYLEVQTEIAFLEPRLDKIYQSLEPEELEKRLEFYKKLEYRNELLQMHNSFKQELESLRSAHRMNELDQQHRQIPVNRSQQPRIINEPSE